MTTEQVYVAIDLETTGLNARRDAIIEIGAVRFACTPHVSPHIRILDRYVTFVNPGRTIPLRIQQLTGITDSDVAEAPSLERIAPELLGFVGADTHYLVAHNAGFDASFLRAGGIDFHRPMQDTFELATILLTGAPSYSLSELARSLNIPLTDAHRALDDAEATAHLFGVLLHRVYLLPSGIRRTLLACGRETQWEPLHLLADVDRTGLTEASRQKEIGVPDVNHGQNDSSHTRAETLPTGDNRQCVETGGGELDDYYSPGGYLNQVLGSHYEYRSGQVDMSTRILEALTQGDHLLIEAGTGTGKTLAYLLPASLWAIRNRGRVIVVTNTIALQDQILDKDMPLVRQLLHRAQVETPRSVQLKGRSNYLCTRRLYLWYRNRALNPAELRLLAKILVWLQITQAGDMAELFMPTAAERAIWQHVNSDAASCTTDRCTASCGGDQDTLGKRYRDFFHIARNRAEEAHLLIVNHALLLSDIETGGRVLPTYENVVIDEAHRLEEAATEQLSFHADWKTMIRWLRDLQSKGELCQQMIDACQHAGDVDSQNHVVNLSSLASTAETGIREFSADFINLVLGQDASIAGSRYTQRIAIDQSFRSQPAWSELEIQWERVSTFLSEITNLLQQLSSDLAGKHWWRSEPYTSYLAELLGIADQIGSMTDAVNQIIYGTGDVQSGKLVAWAEIDERAKEAKLVSAPMFISDTIESELIHSKRSVILTGATLRTGSGFAFIRDRLGLWDVAASTFESPFDYKDSTLLFMPSDMPDPRNNHYQQAVEQAITSAALAADGSTVALFTSYTQLRTTADAIRIPLDRQGITVLQHGTSSRRRLLREYRHTEKAVLLGTRSFWEGVDLPGDELQCLLIVRLPFAVPSDPLIAARTADLENAFRDYTLPDAILRFRQGFGRLIRRSSDRGVVILLDSRIWRKEYGRAFQESLPTCTSKHAPLDTLEDEVREWLRIGSGVT